MTRKAAIKIYDKTAGSLTQDDEGYHFVYDPQYLAGQAAEPISLTMPYRNKPIIAW